MNLLSKSLLPTKLFITEASSADIVAALNVTTFLVEIDNQIDKDIQRSLLVTLGMAIVIILLLVPGWIVLNLRLPVHEKIFDLLASVDAEMVAKEIQSLNYISNIL